MKRSGSKLLIAGILSIQLIAALSVYRPVNASPRTFVSGSTVSTTSRLPELRTERLATNVVASSSDASDHLNYALLNRGILLTGRSWNGVPVDDRLPLNLLVSNGNLFSNYRAFLAGHLIKNAYTKAHPLRVTGAR